MKAEVQQEAPAQSLGKVIVFAIISVIVYLVPFFVLGPDVRITTHDNLDQAPLAFSQLYAEESWLWVDGMTSHRLFNGQYSPEVAGPRIDQSRFFFFHLAPFEAYVATQVASRLVAFFSMYLFLGSWLRGSSELIRLGVSGLWTWVPHYPPVAYSVPLVPLTCWALLAFSRREERWYHWIALVLVVIMSELVATTLFLVPVLVVLVGLCWARKRTVSIPRFSLGVLVLMGLFVVKDWNRFLSVLADQSYTSHRVEMQAVSDGLQKCLLKWFGCLLNGQYHVASYHWPILVSVIGVAVFVLGRTAKSEGAARESLVWLCGMGVTLTLIAALFGFDDCGVLVKARQAMPILGVVALRFYWLSPFLWYAAFALALHELHQRRTFGRQLAVGAMCLQFIWLGLHCDHLSSTRAGSLSFRDFYSSDQMLGIQDYIKQEFGLDPSEYRVASLGMHPAIAMFNGFYCLDGYCVDYSLDYKHAFRKVIAKELAQDEKLRRYFDNWGSRCYLFCSAYGRDFNSADRRETIPEVSFDLEAFRALGGRFILSAVRIEDTEGSGLTLLKGFPGTGSSKSRSMYVYKVKT